MVTLELVIGIAAFLIWVELRRLNRVLRRFFGPAPKPYDYAKKDRKPHSSLYHANKDYRA